jgi:hypothetical protein
VPPGRTAVFWCAGSEQQTAERTHCDVHCTDYVWHWEVHQLALREAVAYACANWTAEKQQGAVVHDRRRWAIVMPLMATIPCDWLQLQDSETMGNTCYEQHLLLVGH